MARPTDFLLNTDYEMDKIIYFYEGKVEANSGDLVSFPHKLPFLPLLFGVWSPDADFNESHTFSYLGAYIDFDDYQGYAAPSVELYAQDENVVMNRQSVTGDFYVRIYGFEPEGSHANLASTFGRANTFILNTDYNYRKLAKKGREPIVFNPSSPVQYDDLTIEHGLGYKPQVMVWLEAAYLDGNNQETTHAIQYDFWQTLDDETGLEVKDNTIVYHPRPAQSPANFYLHYRIYYDEAQ